MLVKTNNLLISCQVALALLGAAFTRSHAALPADLPTFTVTTCDTNAVGRGHVFVEVTDTTNNACYVMIVDNAGMPVWYQAVSNHVYDFKVLPNGYLHHAPFFHTHSWTGGGDVTHEIFDNNYARSETFQAGNGYLADGHDFQLLPNGHVLLLGYYKSQMDLARIVSGAYPNALVAGALIQELDGDRNVVWQWRSWDHYDFAAYYAPVLGLMANVRNPVVDSFHLNTVVLDNDGNLLISNFPVDVQKINRQTGDVMWRLGGFGNQFTFSNVPPPQALGHFAGHTVSRLANSNILIYCNADQQATRSSKVYEYRLDESNKLATLVWSYAPAAPQYAWHYGSCQRLPNGNTFIGWGGGNIMPGIGGVTNAAVPACTEVNAAGQVVFEMKFADPSIYSYRAYRFEWPPTNHLAWTVHELTENNEYTFAGTGVSVEVLSGGGGYNACTVTREPYAPVAPIFLETAPQVLPMRVKLSEWAILDAFGVVLSFDTASFGFQEPGNLRVYHRPQSGQGVFVEQPTAYNPVTRQLQTTLTLNSSGGDFGEFIFCCPDVTQVAYPPLLNQVENYRGVQPYEIVAPLLATSAAPWQVNQQLPVFLSWSPKGFASYYELEIATAPDFATTLVTEPYLSAAFYVWNAAAPGTTFYYRAKTWNAAGDSGWSVGSFQTAAPMIQVTAPNGGESWQRGLKHFIQWSDNLAENVVIDLYKGGVFLKTLATNASTGAYKWTAGLDLVPGNDYAIKVRSQTNAALSDLSDLPFSLDILPVAVSVDTSPSGLNVIVDDTNYVAPAIFNWLPGSSHSLVAVSPQLSGDGRSRSVFASWSDGGPQTNLITVPASQTNYTAIWSTQYLLELSLAPSTAGTISNSPPGPWYDAGQLVSLSASTNAGYRMSFWQGVDSAAGSTAQVTMNGSRAVQANLMASDFPYLVVTNSGAVAPGQLIGNIGGRTADGTKLTYVILDNTGTNALFSSTTQTLWRFVTPQGFDAVASGGSFRLKDENFNVVDAVTTVGPALDTHDIERWPNGHTLLFAQEFRTIDMRQFVPAGKPNANVTGNVIQELDAAGRVVFEWHTFDYIAITNTFADMTQASFDYAHINCVTLDPTDNNLLASLRTTSEIVKINRRTGQVMWRLGGKMNQFIFLNEHPENAPYYTVGQHDVHRLANGNLLFFDNGNISGGGVTPSDRTYSRMVEYQLDEINRTATLVWEYRHTPDISASCTGSLKRMANGNTFIDWGCAVPSSGYIVTEVSPTGDVVFEMEHRTNNGIGSVLLGGGLLKQLWNSPDLIRSATYQGVQSGQAYNSPEAGVSVTLASLSGPSENTLIVQRHLDAVRWPQFPGKAPQVLMEHVVLSASNITSLEAVLSLDLPDTSYVFDTPTIHDPAQLVVYHRPTVGQGQFAALPTTYDAGTRKLRVSSAQLGEFIFGYPDLDETPYVPAIVSPADQSDVNQAAPVTMTWKPQGLLGSSELQVATDAGFASLVLNTNNLGSNIFALQNPLPNTHYYWRVRVVNQGGTSDWASASFTTVPPLLQLTYPAGGEVWQRFQVVTIRWNDNLAENIALDIYRDGISNRTFVSSAASSGSYTWTVGQFQAFPPGTNYTMKIRSATNPSLYDFSEPFAIITNLTRVTVDTVPAGLAVTVDGTNYAAPVAFDWLPRSFHALEAASPQVAADGHSRSLFASWNDDGAQSHSLTVPFAATTNTATFSAQYLLEVSVIPSGAGTVSSEPAGPWYDAGQWVSLTAFTNAGYLFYAWQGIDAQTNNTAQVSMTGYHAVQAKFIPTNGLPVINTPSFVRLPDGQVQFSLSAGAGAADQATVWGTTMLSPPDWRVLATVLLNNGSGTFTDTNAPGLPSRFYRVTLP